MSARLCKAISIFVDISVGKYVNKNTCIVNKITSAITRGWHNIKYDVDL